MGVLGEPEGLEAARLDLGAELVGANRVAGGKHEDADVHDGGVYVTGARRGATCRYGLARVPRPPSAAAGQHPGGTRPRRP